MLRKTANSRKRTVSAASTLRAAALELDEQQMVKPLLEARPLDELTVYDFKKRSGAPLQRYAW